MSGRRRKKSPVGKEQARAPSRQLPRKNLDLVNTENRLLGRGEKSPGRKVAYSQQRGGKGHGTRKDLLRKGSGWRVQEGGGEGRTALKKIKASICFPIQKRGPARTALLRRKRRRHRKRRAKFRRGRKKLATRSVAFFCRGGSAFESRVAC